MRKITFFIALLLGLLPAVQTTAQSLEDYGMLPLIHDVSMLESPFGDEEEGADIGALLDANAETFWHTDWHNKKGDDGQGRHWIQVNFVEPVSGNFVFSMTRRKVTNDHPKTIAVDASTDGVEWLAIDTIKLGTDAPASGPTEVSKVWRIAEPVGHIRFTVTDCTPSFRKYWHASEMQIYSAEGPGMSMYTLNQALLKYDAYVFGETMDIGTAPGQYSDTEAWQAFLDDLNYVNAYMNGEIADDITPEQADELLARIEANYQAVLDSKVPLDPIPNGYYFISTALEYTTQKVKLTETGDTIFDPETLEPVMETVAVQKAMYANGISIGWKTFDRTDCNFLFRLDYNPETNGYSFYNCATNGRLKPISQSAQGFFDNTLDPVASEVGIVLSRTDTLNGEPRDIIFFGRRDQIFTAAFTYLHQGGHSDGAGNSGNVVGWEGSGASEWYLIPVDEAEAQVLVDAWAPIRDRNVMLATIDSIVYHAGLAMEIAHDSKTIIHKSDETRLITSPEQFFSPNSTTDQQTDSMEELYSYLLDGQQSTYWHSRWEDGEIAAGTHYLQVELTEPEAVTGAAVVMTRRAAAQNDHITVFEVYGCNEPDLEGTIAKANCEYLGTIKAPFGSASETVTTDGFVTKGYKYLRFYITNTECPGVGHCRGYGHASEFQLYPADITLAATRQEVMLGERYTNLQAAIAALPSTQDDITIDHFNALKDAWDAFLEKYVDPAQLRAAITAASNTAASVALGTLPGFWNEGADVALTTAIATAQAYDDGGVYNADEIQQMIDGLSAEQAAMFAAANPVRTDKWYHIHLAPEELFNTTGWGKANLTDETSGMGNLFGQYMTAAHIEQPEGENNDEVIALNSDEVRIDTRLFFTDKTGDDGSMFRFIAVGDTAYVIQNKASGLYIHCAGANNQNVNLSLRPTIFKPQAIGHGLMLLAGNTLSGAGVTNLHAQKAGHRLVTWQAATPESNSALMVEEAEDIDFEAPIAPFVSNLRRGQVYAQCLPVDVASDEGMYSVAGTYSQDDKSYIALNSIAKAEAGQPFLCILGTPAEFAIPAEGEEPITEELHFTAGTTIVAQPDSINGLVGTFAARTVEQGAVVFANNMAQATTAETTDVIAFGAFLRFGETEVEPTGNYALVLEIDGEPTVTAIQKVLHTVAQTGEVYDLNGRLVRSGATLSDVKSLPAGIYILNGVKVQVK